MKDKGVKIKLHITGPFSGKKSSCTLLAIFQGKPSLTGGSPPQSFSNLESVSMLTEKCHWRNFHQWPHRESSKRHFLVPPVTKITSKWWHIRSSGRYLLWLHLDSQVRKYGATSGFHVAHLRAKRVWSISSLGLNKILQKTFPNTFSGKETFGFQFNFPLYYPKRINGKITGRDRLRLTAPWLTIMAVGRKGGFEKTWFTHQIHMFDGARVAVGVAHIMMEFISIATSCHRP